MASTGDSDAANALRRRVFALVRASRPAARARHSRLSAVFARFSAACHALAAIASTAQGGDAHSSDRLVADEQCVWEELERLDALVTCADSAATLELPLLVARCLTAEPTLPRVAVAGQELPRRASRKRSRSDWMLSPPSPHQDDEGTSAYRAPSLWTVTLPTRLSHALANLLLVSALHDAALVRLDALLIAIESNASALCDTIRLVLGADPVALPGSWRRVLKLRHGVRRRSRGSEGGSEPRECDSQALVECIVAQLVQLAFSNAANEAPGVQDEDKHHLPARAAMSTLDALCSLSPSLPLALQTLTLCVVIDALPSSRQSPARTVRFSGEAIDKTRDTSERGSSQSTAFLSGVLHSFLCRAAAERRAEADTCSGVIDAVLRVLPSSATIQVG